jgi:alkyl sulfatase BDS1-like metallo-beta-lactamase superfamily hydrolase
LLTHALHLEGKLDWFKPSKYSMVPPPTVDSMMRMPVGTLVKILETKIDPVKSAALVKTITIKFSDTGDAWALHVRKGVAEVSVKIPSSVDASLTITREDWIAIALKVKSFEDVLQSGHATVSGDAATLFAVLSVFE